MIAEPLDAEAFCRTAADIVRQLPMPNSILSTVMTVKGAVWRGTGLFGGWWKPCYCANCGLDGSLVPESSQFTFWLCDKCEKYGAIDNVYMVPDEIFWAKAHLEMYESYGRLLSPVEVNAIVAADASPFATLLREGR